MDPLSIATALFAASQAVFSVSTSLQALIKSAKVVDKSLDALHDEVKNLTTVLDAITSTVEQPLISEARENTVLASGVWKSIEHAVKDCQHTIAALQEIVDGFGDLSSSKSFSKLQKTIKQVKLNISANDISSIRSRIHTHSISLQLALQMATL